MSTAALELHELRFRWRRNHSLLLDIKDLRVRQGERLFLHGPSGSGKSTLLNLIGGVLVPETGTARVLDTDLGALHAGSRDRFRADHIGFIFQQFNLLPYLDVMNNVLLALRFSPRRQARLGSAATAEARRSLHALGLTDETLLHQPASELSVGQQQRVAAARALLGTPEIVIADEPTSALDANHRAAFMDLLLRECDRNDATLIFVSHDLALSAGFEQRLHLPDFNRVAATTQTLQS